MRQEANGDETVNQWLGFLCCQQQAAQPLFAYAAIFDIMRRGAI
jgi:hypothetical protein